MFLLSIFRPASVGYHQDNFKWLPTCQPLLQRDKGTGTVKYIIMGWQSKNIYYNKYNF